MLKFSGKAPSKVTETESTSNLPHVTRVTPEGRLLYDPLSVIRSEPARKHLGELEKKDPINPKANAR